MATYTWEGQSRSGEVSSGEMNAESENEVITRLKNQGVEPTKIRKKSTEINIDLTFGGGVSMKELVIFTRQFATMIDAGLPLVQALDILASAEPNKNFQKKIYAIKADVEQGATFAQALGRHPKVFDELYVNLVAAGEVGGILDTILQRLAVYIEKSVALARKVKGAFTYPTAILVIAILIVIGLLWKVIPTFEGMFQDMGEAELPALTQWVIDASDTFLANWYLYIGALVGVVVAFKLFVGTKRGRELFDAFMFRTPLFGPLIQKNAVARFTRTMGTMVAAGVPILDALEIVARSAGNKVIEKAIMRVRDRIAEGRTMAEPLAETGVFPPMVVQMIGVGEATGAMDTMLGKIADFYEDEVDQTVDALTALLEPFMMVFIGGIVGGLLIAMYLPIFTMGDSIGA